MKKIVTFTVMFGAVAILGTALTWAMPDENSDSSEASAKAAKPCCQAEAAAVTQSVADTTTATCCNNVNTKEAVLAGTESISGEVCQIGKKNVGCALCGKDAVATTTDSANFLTTTTAQAKVCSEGQCPDSATGNQCGSTNSNESGGGMGHGRGLGKGNTGDSQHDQDHQDFLFLIEHRDSIRRTVKSLPNGIESQTESDDAAVAEMIQVHVEAMYHRVENANPIRMRDPIFREVFANADKIKMEVERTDKGVRVKETSTDVYTVKLLQEHAKVVSLWIKNGYSELPKNHAAPKR